MEAQYKTAGNAIIHELLDNEVIIANLDNGIYYSIRQSGVPVWQLLLAGHSVATIVTAITRQYTQDSQTLLVNLNTFINQLITEQLIVEKPTSTVSPIQDSSILWNQEYQPPLFEKYDDMQALLMLDPIHEVDEDGWPTRA